MLSAIKGLFSKSKANIARYSKIVAQINALEADVAGLSDADLTNKAQEYKQRIQQGETQEALLPEVFALVREVAKRELGMRHYDVQCIGGIALFEGQIAEMKTGEGKTLVATLPICLRALAGEQVHLVTVNDYLARRDSQWMNRVYSRLGLTCSNIYNSQPHQDKQKVYACDIVYGANSEFGFDFLRDQMVMNPQSSLQKKGLQYAIIDEIDSILIDEARTPLIISGESEEAVELYKTINSLIGSLKRQDFYKVQYAIEEKPEDTGDFMVDEESRDVVITDRGQEHIEQLLFKAKLIDKLGDLYSLSNQHLMHHVIAALKAHQLFKRDIHYLIQNGEVRIVDESTGRVMPGRRWSDGLHQAVEAKESVPIQKESQTLASISYQNFFRSYKKISGMTGTAMTEAKEFQQIYNLQVMEIPTHMPLLRVDQSDKIFATKKEKYVAIVEAVKQAHAEGQPVLIGTSSVESSEEISQLMRAKKLTNFNLLNARFHEKEAEIIAQAGKPGAITISTNMAGRGTDILLGGNLQASLDELSSEEEKKQLQDKWQQDKDLVLQKGGLFVIGSERHESRRVDNQLRGRSGRQGDPGKSCFYLSLEDDLIRVFAGERMRKIMVGLGLKDGEAIEHSMIDKSVAKAQKRVEERNFDIRKQLLEYDDINNIQRLHFYEIRNAILHNDDALFDKIETISLDVLDSIVQDLAPEGSNWQSWDLEQIEKEIKDVFHLEVQLKDCIPENELKVSPNLLLDHLAPQVRVIQKIISDKLHTEALTAIARQSFLQTMDYYWRAHLTNLTNLRQSIHFAGYAQRNPKSEYQLQSLELFQKMFFNIHQMFLHRYFGLSVADQGVIDKLNEIFRMSEAQTQIKQQQQEAEKTETENKGLFDKPVRLSYNLSAMNQDTNPQHNASRNAFAMKKPGRNELCYCGSGKKYKKCHGA